MLVALSLLKSINERSFLPLGTLTSASHNGLDHNEISTPAIEDGLTSRVLEREPKDCVTSLRAQQAMSLNINSRTRGSVYI